MAKNKQELLHRFVQYNKDKRYLNGKRILLAVSGGLDSVALCALMAEAGYSFAIAHCNFGLRGAESDADEQFVKAYAARLGVELYCTRFDTAAFAAENKTAIQEAARKLRYDWFEEIRQQHAYDYITTAHHASDSIETVLFNLAKGTGIKGMRGIQYKNGKIVRPLLFATREEIAAYVADKGLAYREDSSNASDKYSRNFIRHNIVPLFKEVNPSFEHTFISNLKVFEEVEVMVEKQLKAWNRTLVFPSGEYEKIAIAKLKQIGEQRTVLFAILQKYGFNTAQVEDILSGLHHEPGRQFISATHRVIQDRKFLIVTGPAAEKAPVIFIEQGTSQVQFGGRLLKLSFADSKDTVIEKQANTAQVDAKGLAFPLLLRQWKEGDYFYPLGMGMKKKKVKKFLTDIKLPLHERQQVWVLESDKKIVWVLGHRIDERFAVNANTASVLSFSV